jgi:DNA gyrase subunit B
MNNEKNLNMNKDIIPNEYGAQQIRVLKGLEAIKTRPGMYIGNTEDGTGLHHLVYEVLANSVDEALAGYCSIIKVTFMKDGKVKVEDDGRGIPIAMHPVEGLPTPEIIFTTLHSGGKFDEFSYTTPGGLHGVGLSAVNALSDTLEVEILRDGQRYRQSFTSGVPSPCEYSNYSGINTGTSICFLPAISTFKNITFDLNIFQDKFEEIAYLNQGVNIELNDEINGVTKHFTSEHGLVDFLDKITKSIPIAPAISFEHKIDRHLVKVALKWIAQSFEETIKCYTNNIPQSEGGTHLIGFKSGLSKAFIKFINQENKNKQKLDISSEDIRAGMVACLSIHTPTPMFSSQTKDKLVNSDIRRVVDEVLSNHMFDYLMENQVYAQDVIDHILVSSRSRTAARQARDINRQTKPPGIIHSLTGKLAFCKEKNPELCELFLVEGDSAAGPAKQARIRQTQAILPLRGKILNVEKSNIKSMLKSTEILNILMALGVQLDANLQIRDLKYHKVIIMTDADVDGRHINCLIMTLFYRHLRPIIENGYLYLAQPPLYMCKVDGKELFVKNDAHLNNLCKELSIANFKVMIQGKEVSTSNVRSYFEMYTKIQDIIEGYTHSIPRDILIALGSMHDFSVYKDFPNFSKLWQSKLMKYLPEGKYSFVNDVAVPALECEIDGIIHEYNLRDFLRSVHYADMLESFKELDKVQSPEITKISNESISTHANMFEALHWMVNHERNVSIKGIKRFKGLGEMQVEQLWTSTMNPETRQLIQVSIEDAARADELFDVLMGPEVEVRREFIIQNSKFIKFQI